MAKKARSSNALTLSPAAAEEDGLASSGAADRCFAILEFVARHGTPLTPVEISDALALPKPTAYRLLDTLERMGFLSRQGGARRITAGPRLTDLAFNVLRASVRYGPRRLILEALVREVGETGNIGTIDHNEIVYLDRVEADHWPLRLQFNIGSRVPLYCTAIGKLFLALMPEETSKILLDRLDYVPCTANSIIDRKRLEDELDAIRADRLSLDREEYIVGVVCIAAPIFDKRGAIRAAVAVQAPAARMPVDRALTYRSALVTAAEQLSESFNTLNPKG